MKKVVIGIVIGAIIFGSIGVYAITKYLSEEIQYKETNVKEALDTLYEHRYHEEYLSGYVATANRSKGGDNVASKPTISESNNIVTINNNSNAKSQGAVYVKIENIEKYDFLIVEVKGAAKSAAVGLVKNIDVDQFTYIRNISILKYSNVTEREVFPVIYMNTKGLSGTYNLAIYGTYWKDLTFSARGVY